MLKCANTFLIQVSKLIRISLRQLAEVRQSVGDKDRRYDGVRDEVRRAVEECKRMSQARPQLQQDLLKRALSSVEAALGQAAAERGAVARRAEAAEASLMVLRREVEERLRRRGEVDVVRQRLSQHDGELKRLSEGFRELEARLTNRNYAAQSEELKSLESRVEALRKELEKRGGYRDERKAQEDAKVEGKELGSEVGKARQVKAALEQILKEVGTMNERNKTQSRYEFLLSSFF